MKKISQISYNRKNCGKKLIIRKIKKKYFCIIIANNFEKVVYAELYHRILRHNDYHDTTEKITYI